MVNLSSEQSHFYNLLSKRTKSCALLSPHISAYVLSATLKILCEACVGRVMIAPPWQCIHKSSSQKSGFTYDQAHFCELDTVR